jgi:hypothetical protein
MKKMKKSTKVIIAIVIIAVILVIVFTPWPSSTNTPSNNTSVNQAQLPQLPQQNQTPQNHTPSGTGASCPSDYGDVNTSEFMWNNMSWSFENNEGSTFYKTTLSFLERNGRDPLTAVLTLRKNPNKTESLSNITKMPKNITYVAYDNSAMECKDTMLSTVETGYFLGLSGIEAKGVVTDPARSKDPEFVKDCSDASENVTVIVIQKKAACQGVSESNNCIIIDAGNDCKILEAVESYILNMIKLGIAKGTIKAV